MGIDFEHGAFLKGKEPGRISGLFAYCGVMN